MKKLIIIFLIATMASVGLILGCAKEQNEMKIGVILPLTGDAAQWGIPPQKGAELAAQEINGSQYLGKMKLKLVVEDGKCDPKEAVAAFNKLTSVDRVGVILGEVCSSSTLAMAPLAEKTGTLLISPASTNPKITEAGDFIFRVIPSDDLRGKVFAKYLLDKGIRRVGLVYINNDGGKGISIAFRQLFESKGGQIPIEETYEPGATDLRSQLTKLKTHE